MRPSLAAPRPAARHIVPRPLPARYRSGDPPGVVVARCRRRRFTPLPPLARTGAVLAVPLTSVLRILCNHLIENNIGMPYISAISSLLEGRSLDLNLSRHKPTEERDTEAAPSSPKDVKS